MDLHCLGLSVACAAACHSTGYCTKSTKYIYINTKDDSDMCLWKICKATLLLKKKRKQNLVTVLLK